MIQPDESAAADEQNVAGIDPNEFLMWMLAAALRRNIRDGAFDQFQQCLLDAFAGDIAGDRRAVALAADLIDFIDIDDAAFRPLDIVIRGLQELENNILHILADIPGFREGGRIGQGERDIQISGEGLRQQRFPRAGRTDHEDVALLQFDFIVFIGRDSLVVIMDGDRQEFFWPDLARSTY